MESVERIFSQSATLIRVQSETLLRGLLVVLLRYFDRICKEEMFRPGQKLRVDWRSSLYLIHTLVRHWPLGSKVNNIPD